MTVKFYIALSIVFVLLGCNNTNIKDPSKISGNWISESYLLGIEKSKNPQRVFRNDGYEILFISSENIKNDTVKMTSQLSGQSESSGFGFYHVENDSIINFLGRSYSTPNKITMNVKYAHKYVYREKSDMLVYYHSDGTQNRFIRLAGNSLSNCLDSLELEISSMLFTGVYDFNSGNVAFDKSGHVKGLEDYHSYSVGIDYSFENILYGCNYIEFYNKDYPKAYYDATENLRNRFGYEFASDTIKLFEIIEDTTNNYSQYGLIKGVLKYELIKNAP